MKYIKAILFILSFTMALIFFSCEKGTEPEPLKPGRRDYFWTIDTLPNSSYMGELWGSSPSDIWAIGAAGNITKTIYHFDGDKWSTDNIYRPISPRSIFGFSKDNIYIGGHNGTIWHYDGSNWAKNAELKKDGNIQVVFEHMWGSSKNDLFAFGAYPDESLLANNSVIAHYDGSEWAMLNTNGIVGIVNRFYKNEQDGKSYLLSYRSGGGEFPDSSLIYECTEGKYNFIYGNYWSHSFQCDISLINDEVYFIMGSTIEKRINDEFQLFLMITNHNFYQRIWGRNSKDIFLLMTDGLVHYNGIDMEYLFYFNVTPKTQIYSAMLFENEVFFLTFEYLTNSYLIYHGKLNGG